jgi:RNA polymerase-binding transcription factor
MKNPEINLSAMKAALMARREELSTLAASSAESRATVELDQTTVGRLSRMDALQGQQMALETERRRHAEMRRIEAALERIEANDFGYCLSCDEQIAPKRLTLDPSVALCITCAGKG